MYFVLFQNNGMNIPGNPGGFQSNLVANLHIETLSSISVYVALIWEHHSVHILQS